MNLSMLLQALGRHMIKKSLTRQEIPDMCQISFLDQAPASDEGIYIGTPEQIENCSFYPPECVFFSAGSCSDSFFQGCCFTLIMTDFELLDLYAWLSGYIHDLSETQADFFQLLYKKEEPMPALSAYLSRKLNSAVFILTEELQLICADGLNYWNAIEKDKILQRGRLSKDDEPLLFRLAENVRKKGYAIIKTVEEQRFAAAFLQASSNASFFVFLCQIHKSEVQITEYLRLLALTFRGCRRTLFSADYKVSSLNALLDLYCSGGELSAAQLLYCRSQMVYPLEESFAFLVLEFSEKIRQQGNYPEILRQIQQMIPHQNATVYANDIVILITSKDYFPYPSIDYKALDALLARYNGIAGVGNTMVNYANGYLSYSSAKECIRLSRKYVIRSFEWKRIFFRDDYLMLSVIQSALKNGSMFFPKGSLYMSLSGVVLLAIHDQQKNDNLVQVLKYYLSSRYIISVVAEKLHMHRNTVYNKLKKIQDILKYDIDNPARHLSILFSCEVMEYYKTFLNHHAVFEESPFWDDNDTMLYVHVENDLVTPGINK